MAGRWGETPFVALAFCLVAGICASLAVSQYCFGGLAAGTFITIVGAWTALRRDRMKIALALGLSAITVVGLMLALARRDAFPSKDVRARLAHGEIPINELLPFEGCVVEEGRERDDELVTTIDLRALKKRDSWMPCNGMGILRIPSRSAESDSTPMVPVSQGDRIRGWAAWQVPRNYQNPGAVGHAEFLRRRGIFLQGRVKSTRLLEVIPGDCLDPWAAMANGARKRLRKNLLVLRGPDSEIQARILAAIVIGDYSTLGTAIREAFQNSGTYHVLVVSGLHVGWIAWVLIALSRLLLLPQGAGRILAVACIFYYVSIVGFQASISRSLWTFLIYLTGQALFRRSAPANIALASAFLLLCSRPDWMFDAGFQLSFLAVLSICMTGAPIIERNLKPLFDPAVQAGRPDRIYLLQGRTHFLGRSLRTMCELLAEAAADRWHPSCECILLFLLRTAARAWLAATGMFVISLSVQLWLEPLLAYHFNRLSWIASVANLVMIPLSSLVLAAGLLSSITADIPGMGQGLLALAGWLSTLLLRTASTISEIPGAWQRCPTPALAWVVGGILLIFAWCFMNWHRKWAPCLCISSVLLCLSIGRTPLDLLPRPRSGLLKRDSTLGMDANKTLVFTFLDVGEGDALVLRFPDSRLWVVDAGGVLGGHGGLESDHAFNVGEAVVSRFLWSQWITKIDTLVLTHPDIDHAGGAPALLKNFKIDRLAIGKTVADPLLARVLPVALARGVPVFRMNTEIRVFLAGIDMEILNPPDDSIQRPTNESSIVMRLSCGRFTALLTGDLEKATEREVIERWPELQSLLLKVAHHGSRWATMDPLLERLHARWAILSAGRNNPFGHPSREVVARLLRHGVLPVLTMDQGAITFATDGRRYVLSSYAGGIFQRGVLPQSDPRDRNPWR